MSAAPRDASLLQVPASEPAAVEDEEDDEDAFKVHLIPRSSPTPRKKAAGCQETEDPSLSRKVSFADTRGLALEEVQYFTEFAFPESPEPPELGARQAAECPFYVFPAFVLPADPAQLLQRVRAGKVALETIEPAEGDPLSVRGWVRVLNLSYQKAVHVRATLDGWATYFDHPADYVPERSPGETDRFAFRLSFVAPYVRDGGRLEFVVRYQTPEAVHWANNGGANYSLVCKVKERAPAIAAAGVADTGPSPLKSCLKPAVF
uniref:protein phosphatase 1 regulatory subunit 3A-like n=1 Tax=Pristiophorus japonicus TaxID=55135 RepID=UPI00398E5C31